MSKKLDLELEVISKTKDYENMSDNNGSSDLDFLSYSNVSWLYILGISLYIGYIPPFLIIDYKKITKIAIDLNISTQVTIMPVIL